MDYIETVFLPQNFMHLTGVVPCNKSLSSVNFYNACINGKLTPALFDMSRDGTTHMKLSVLPQIMNIHKVARMAGDFTENKIKLNTEKIVGNIHACMGFVQALQIQGYFVPNTVLREDIRDIVEKPTRKVLAVFRKAISANRYDECTYVSKNINLTMIKDCIKFAQLMEE